MDREKAPVWIKVLAVLYAAIMLWLLLGQRIGRTTVNGSEYFAQYLILTPFTTVNRFWTVLKNGGSRGNVIHAFVNLVGNVIMFIPLGIFPSVLCRKLRGFWRCMLFCAAVIILVELTQLLARLGTCDIDDLILNLFGAALGYMMLTVITKISKK